MTPNEIKRAPASTFTPMPCEQRQQLQVAFSLRQLQDEHFAHKGKMCLAFNKSAHIVTLLILMRRSDAFLVKQHRKHPIQQHFSIT